MIVIISPATTMDFDREINIDISSTPYFINEANYLANILKTLDLEEVQALMNLSKDLGQLNLERYQQYGTKNNIKKQSISAFNGEVFSCMNISDFVNEDFIFTNEHFRILSGLYGILLPLDNIEPYRLEMKAKLKNTDGPNLYKFWKNRITTYLINEAKFQKHETILNLASSEYSKAIDLKEIQKHCTFINIEFKDFDKNKNKYRVVGMYSKQARGYMSRLIIKNKIDSIEEIKNLNINGYKFNADMSNELNIIFTR